MGKRQVLFLCTGNSCRSQMAEAIVNYRLGERWEAVSAGMKPMGTVHSKALVAPFSLLEQGSEK
jgi:arsenate reductase